VFAEAARAAATAAINVFISLSLTERSVKRSDSSGKRRRCAGWRETETLGGGRRRRRGDEQLSVRLRRGTEQESVGNRGTARDGGKDAMLGARGAVFVRTAIGGIRARGCEFVQVVIRMTAVLVRGVRALRAAQEPGGKCVGADLERERPVARRHEPRGNERANGERHQQEAGDPSAHRAIDDGVAHDSRPESRPASVAQAARALRTAAGRRLSTFANTSAAARTSNQMVKFIPHECAERGASV
jgi:hypothetical protein